MTKEEKPVDVLDQLAKVSADLEKAAVNLQTLADKLVKVIVNTDHSS